MRCIKYFILCAMLLWGETAFAAASVSSAATSGSVTVEEADGSPRVSTNTIKVTNGSLTDNGDGTVTVTTSGGGSLTVVEADASPSVSSVTSITVPNGSLTDNGSGSVTFTPAGTGDVVGPASSTDNAVVRFDLATGKLVQNSGVLIDDTNNVTGAASVAFGADPGDSGPLRLSNNTGITWELATPGTDKQLKVNADNQLDFNGDFNLSGATTGSVQVNGATSGGVKITTADATGYLITITGAAQTVGAPTVTIPDLADVDQTITFNALAATLTNKTVDCTTAGNVCTITRTMTLPLAGVAGGTAGHIWDDAPTLTTCTPGSTAGTNQTIAFCTFADADGDYGRAIPLHLPASFVADSVTFIVEWKTTGTGNARFRIRTLCYASDAASDSAYSNSTYVTAAAGTSARFNKTSATAVTTTGCDAGETMFVQFERNRTEAFDTLNAALDVRQVILAWSEAQ